MNIWIPRESILCGTGIPHFYCILQWHKQTFCYFTSDVSDRVVPAISDRVLQTKITMKHQIESTTAECVEGPDNEIPPDDSSSPSVVERTRAAESSNEGTKPLIILVHGIRTRAHWQDWMKDLLAAHGATVRPLKYGYLDAIRFWCPFLTRNRPIKILLGRINDAVSLNPDKPLIIIAHSFGTYAVTKILEDNPNIRPKRLLLCGSIVRTNYRWVKFGQLAEEHSVLNDCADKDVWPALAQGLSFGYGASGTFGFGDALAVDRFHAFGHSGYFSKAFVESYWIPWIFDKQIVPSKHDASASMCMNVLANFKSILFLLLAVLLFLGYLFGTWPFSRSDQNRYPANWQEQFIKSGQSVSGLDAITLEHYFTSLSQETPRQLQEREGRRLVTSGWVSNVDAHELWVTARPSTDPEPLPNFLRISKAIINPSDFSQVKKGDKIWFHGEVREIDHSEPGSKEYFLVHLEDEYFQTPDLKNRYDRETTNK